MSEWPEQKDFFLRVMESINKTDEIQVAMKRKLGVYYNYIEGLDNLQKNTGIQARMPFDLVIQ